MDVFKFVAFVGITHGKDISDAIFLRIGKACKATPNIFEAFHCWLLVIWRVKLGVVSIPKLPLRRFFFRATQPGEKRRTIADTCRQGKTMKTLATNINRLLQL